MSSRIWRLFISRRYDSASSAAHSSRTGVIEKNVFWPMVERPGESSIAPPNERMNSGRPVDVERLVHESDDARARGRRPRSPVELLAATEHELVGGRVVGGDRVERAADERALVVGHRLAGTPCRPDVARDADHLRPDGGVLALGPARIPAGGDLGVAQRVAQLRRVQRLAQRGPPAAGRDHRRRAIAIASSASRGLGRGGTQARQDRVDAGSPEAAASAVRRRPGRARHPADPLRRDLGVEPRDRTRRVPMTARASARSRGMPSSRPGTDASRTGAARTHGRAAGGARRRSGRPTAAGPMSPRAAPSRRTGTPRARRGAGRGRSARRASGPRRRGGRGCGTQRVDEREPGRRPASLMSDHWSS